MRTIEEELVDSRHPTPQSINKAMSTSTTSRRSSSPLNELFDSLSLPDHYSQASDSCPMFQRGPYLKLDMSKAGTDEEDKNAQKIIRGLW
jgi:hypothetical protein